MGKAQKCSFLLDGPPGTGKSCTIAAMANFLEYDVYDLELMVVKDNIDLKELLMSTSSKSIVVIEDIVCSLNITGQRNGKEMNEKHKTKVTSKVTLSVLMNVIDGIWSVCAWARLVCAHDEFFGQTRPKGRMDKHIELPNCCF